MDAAQLRPLAVGEILDLAIKIYRERFAHLVKAAAVVVAPVAVFRALVQLSIVPDGDEGFFSGPVDATGQPTIDGGELWSLLAGLVLVGLVSMISSQLATGASFKLVSGAYLDEAPDWRGSLGFATARLGSLVWLTLVFGFLVGLGFVACIVPGVYLYVAWSVAVPALLLDDVRGRRALRRSRGLVRGRWWPTVGVLLVAFFLSAIVQSVISGLLLVVVSVGDNDLVVAAAQAIADTVGTVLTTPFTAAVTTVVYFDLRVRKEGFDLELLARRVGVEPPPAVAPAPGYGAAGRPPGWSPTPGPAGGGEGAGRPPFWPPPPGWHPGAGEGAGGDPAPFGAPRPDWRPPDDEVAERAEPPPFWPPPEDWRPPDDEVGGSADPARFRRPTDDEPAAGTAEPPPFWPPPPDWRAPDDEPVEEGATPDAAGDDEGDDDPPGFWVLAPGSAPPDDGGAGGGAGPLPPPSTGRPPDDDRG